MGIKRSALPLIGAAVVMVVAGCSSTKSSSAAGPAAPSSSAATATSTAAGSSPTTAASTGASSASAGGSTGETTTASGHSISDLVGTGGEISTAKMPAAKPEWIARIQPLTTGGAKIDAKSLNLLALVDEAAREHDVFGLVRLSNGTMSEAKLAQPGVLDNLVTLLEKTHPGATDGLNYPGFTMDGGAATPANTADLKALGVTSAAAYKGVTTSLREGMGAPGEWQGIVFHS